jgi:conjugal transfer pilus assembly protein TraW
MCSRHFLPSAFLCLAALAGPAAARDYGQLGTVYPVMEPDLLTQIEQRLKTAEASGKIALMQQELVRRTKARVMRPRPVSGLTRAVKARSWAYDPTITVEQDIRDDKGRVIAAKGQKINPLDHVPLRQSLVFLDGDDPAQVAWALRSTTQVNAKLILTNGSPFERMKSAQRRFFFDQEGKLTAKFGIRAVPAVVEADGRVLKVSEVPVPPAGRIG